ncbi:MAG TPA: VOC family protein [Lacunisphaera sp.]|jgi:hypothetical protein
MKNLALLFFAAVALTASGEDYPAINSVPTNDYFRGKFIWGDVFTADPVVTQTFYTRLFGWTAKTIERPTAKGPRAYIVLSNHGRPIAGIVQRPAKLQDADHGRWVGYVSVPDVAHALAVAEANGGYVLSRSKDRPNRGTQGVFTDAEGAMLGVMHSGSGDPGEYFPDPGDWTWAELFERDPDAAALFYHTVVGYDRIADNRTDKLNNFILVSGGFSRASVSTMSALPHAHPTWLLFVRVANVKDAVTKVVSLGGRVLVPPADAPTDYWRAIIADPSGAHIGLVEIEDSHSKEASP